MGLTLRWIHRLFCTFKNAARIFEPMVIVHGGSGEVPEDRVPGKLRGVKLAVRTGYKRFANGGSSLDVVEEAVRSMELDEYFNAGYGAVLNLEGNVELDASIMEGDTMNAGCVTLVHDVLHPITLARRVLDKSNHTFIGGEGATKFAKEQGIEVMSPPGQLVTEYAKKSLEEYKLAVGMRLTDKKPEAGEDLKSALLNARKTYGEVGTVGAVAIDAEGNIAVATSTGGITGKVLGRVGDTPLLGSGTYADNLVGGVSTTGHGETIMRFNLASSILSRIKYLGEDAQTATSAALEEMTARLVGTAGAVTIDHNGNFGVWFTSGMMSWAYQQGDKVHSGIYKGDDYVENA